MELCSPTDRSSSKNPVRCPSYLYQNPSGFVFRIGIPSDIRPYFAGKTEFRYSLKTGAVGEAKYRVRNMAACAQRAFRNIRNGGRMASMTPEQIAELMRDYFRQALEDYEDTL